MNSFKVEFQNKAGWTDAGWTIADKPERFGSETEANQAISDQIEDLKRQRGIAAVLLDPANYRVTPATEEPNSGRLAPN